jgi:pentatricopeptide repeat protein
LNLFEDMAGYHLYPTDYTFNVLINACAKRPDYYNEAFSLLDQMQEGYGFQPDKITFNTLLTACARKKDLGQARNILKAMWKDVERNGAQSLLAPDSKTYTNLFWCYASYNPSTGQQQQKMTNGKSAATTSTAVSTERHLLPLELPNKRSKVVKEAEWLFNQLPDNGVTMTPALLTSYLALHISQKQTGSCIDIYTKTFDQFGVQKDAFTFYHMLQYCYNNKDDKIAWKVWEDYQDFLESRRKDIVSDDIVEKKAGESKRNALAIKEGWTDIQQQKMTALMANTLGRSNDLKNSLSILRVSAHPPPRLRDMMPVYNKCIQLEDLDAKRELVQICVKDQKYQPGNSKYKRVNRTD